MAEKSKAVKVGIFLTIIILIFVLGQMWMMRFNVGKEGYYIDIFFNDVSGLKQGDPVRVYGIKKGKVVDMTMRRDGVIVKIWLQRDIQLKEDAEVSIQDVAMISGTKTVVINPGISEQPMDTSRVIRGQPNLGLSTVEIGTITTKVEDLIGVLKTGISGSQGAIKNLQLTLGQLEKMLRENREGIRMAIQEGGKDMKKAGETLEELTVTVKRLDSILTHVSKGKGTMGKLIYDEKLYNNLTGASANLDSLLADIRKNPGKYVRVSVF